MVVGRSLLASAITVQNQTSLIKFVLNQLFIDNGKGPIFFTQIGCKKSRQFLYYPI